VNEEQPTKEEMQHPDYRVGSTLNFVRDEPNEKGEKAPVRVENGVALQFRTHGTDDILEIHMSTKGASILGTELIQIAEQGVQTGALVRALMGENNIEPNYEVIMKLLDRIGIERTGADDNVEFRAGTMTEDEARGKAR
jgi:hypothetical protein